MKHVALFLLGSVIGTALLAQETLVVADVPASVIPLLMQFDARGVSVSGVTLGGKVLFFGLAREVGNSKPPLARRVRRAVVLADDDQDGIVRFDLAEPLPHVAIWAAVDLTTGAHVVSPSPGYEPTELSLTDALAKTDNSGQLKKLEWPFAELLALVVRPGLGAWQLSTSKYGQLDENAQSEQPLRIDLEAMAPLVGSTPPPRSFKLDDLLVLFDPRGMQYAVVGVAH